MRVLKALFKSLNFDWEQKQNSSELLEPDIQKSICIMQTMENPCGKI